MSWARKGIINNNNEYFFVLKLLKFQQGKRPILGKYTATPLECHRLRYRGRRRRKRGWLLRPRYSNRWNSKGVAVGKYQIDGLNGLLHRPKAYNNYMPMAQTKENLKQYIVCIRFFELCRVHSTNKINFSNSQHC